MPTDPERACARCETEMDWERIDSATLYHVTYTCPECGHVEVDSGKQRGLELLSLDRWEGGR